MSSPCWGHLFKPLNLKTSHHDPGGFHWGVPRFINGSLGWWGGRNLCFPLFTVSFLGSLLKFSFTSYGFAQYNWHSFEQLPTWRFFLWMSLMQTKRSLIQKNNSTTFHRWPELWHYICFVQSEEALMVTHSRACTHTAFTKKVAGEL